MSARQLAENWTDIAAQLLKIGATAYGGPAIMGVMQAELQEKRQWVSKERFMDGLSLVNMLPGATAAQLGIFLGYTRAGWWGGLLGGLCFVLPGFLVLMALTMGYAALGVTPGTATTMVKALAESGLVEYEPYNGVRLSRAGSRLAGPVRFSVLPHTCARLCHEDPGGPPLWLSST